MEGDLCLGDAQGVSAFMKERYPAKNLIANIVRPDLDQNIKAMLIKILNYLYIENPSHVFMKYTRAYRAFQDISESLRDSLYNLTKEIDSSDFELLRDWM